MFVPVFLKKIAITFSFSLVLLYYACIENSFLNVACLNTHGLEKMGDTLLIPYQYAFVGRCASKREDASWFFRPRFEYTHHFWIKNIPSWLLTPLSLGMGGVFKSLAYLLSAEMQNRYQSLAEPQPIHLQNERYKEIGLYSENPISSEWFVSEKMERGAEALSHLQIEKEALREIGSFLTQAQILWWVDCGTCLGAYRYGGVIPWDFDVDIAILEPDFENVYQLLKKMDSKKYRVFDVSGRDHPMSLLRVVVLNHPDKEIDIYVYRIDGEKKTLNFILSQENHIFLNQSWKIRERPFKAPVRFEIVFPLKRALFDGIEVFVPSQIVPYLTRVYGEDLRAAKKYNSKTGKYEKDESHSYWNRPYAH